MNEETKRLLQLYLLFIIIKFILAVLIISPLGFADSYIYLRIGKSIFESQTLAWDNVIYNIYPPLYSLSISPAFVFDTMSLIIVFIKLINSIMINTLIFPIFFIAKEFLNKKDAFRVTWLVNLLPPFILFPAYILSENLFYPLFVFAIYCLYKSFTSPSVKWDIFAGLFTGLAYITKINALILPAVLVIATFALHQRITKKNIFNKLYNLGAAALVAIPWIAHNTIRYGFTIHGLFGQYADQFPRYLGFNLFSRGYWTLLHLDYAILATGVIFFLLLVISLFEKKDIKLNILCWLTIIATGLASMLAGFHSGSYANWKDALPHERYITMVFPFILLAGFIAWKRGYHKKIKIWHLFLLSALFVLGLGLLQFLLVPVNNISLAYYGVMKKILGVGAYKLISTGIFICSPLSVLIIKNRSVKNVYRLFMILLIITFSISYAIVMYDANYVKYNYDVSKMGRWIDKHIDNKAVIFYDEENHPFSGKFNSRESKAAYILYPGMWFSNKILSVNSAELREGYLITTKELQYPLLYESEWEQNKLRLYKL